MIIAHTWGQYGEWQVCPTTSRNTTNRAERILASREGTPPPGELYEQPSGPSPLTNISYADHLTHLYLEASRVALELRLLLVFFLWPRWPSSVFLGCSDSCWGVPGLGPQLSPPDLWASVSTEGLGPCLLLMFSPWETRVLGFRWHCVQRTYKFLSPTFPFPLSYRVIYPPVSLGFPRGCLIGIFNVSTREFSIPLSTQPLPGIPFAAEEQSPAQLPRSRAQELCVTSPLPLHTSCPVRQ